jgi:hypothetical protein
MFQFFFHLSTAVLPLLQENEVWVATAASITRLDGKESMELFKKG